MSGNHSFQPRAPQPSLPSVLEDHNRLLTEAVAANTRIFMPFLRAAMTPVMMAAKTGIYYGPNPMMMMTGFSKEDERS